MKIKKVLRYQLIIPSILLSIVLIFTGAREISKSYKHFKNISSQKNEAEQGMKNDFNVSVKKNLENISGKADSEGMWSPVIPWGLVASNAMLLPDGKVLSYGSPKFDRLDEEVIPYGNEAQGGVDYDLWNQSEGYNLNAHYIFEKPLFYNSFCNVQLLHGNEILFVGGQKFKDANGPQSINDTAKVNLKELSKVNVKDKENKPNSEIFKLSYQLNYQRYYASITKNLNDEFVVYGGSDENFFPSTIPESLINDQWVVLKNAESEEAFGSQFYKWWYPKTFITPNHKVFGISTDTVWLHDHNNSDSEIKILGKLDIKRSFGNFVSKQDEEKHIKYGNSSTAIYYDNNKIILLGGGSISANPGYHGRASDEVSIFEIKEDDFTVRRTTNLLYPRNWSMATLLADGKVFVNGGSLVGSIKGHVNESEIWNPNDEKWYFAAKANKDRSYHQTALLLPDGSVLTIGSGIAGETPNQYNGEIYYPPYFFERNWENKIVLSKRPIIKNIESVNKTKLNLTFESERGIEGANFIALGNVTHGHNYASKVIKFDNDEISFINENSLEIDIKNLSLGEVADGYYMIFLLDKKNFPSIAKIVKIVKKNIILF